MKSVGNRAKLIVKADTGEMITFEGTSAEVRTLLAVLMYKDVKIQVNREDALEREVKKRKWSTYISPQTLAKVERTMMRLGEFTTKDVVKLSGFSRTTVLRAIKVLTERGKLKVEGDKLVYVG